MGRTRSIAISVALAWSAALIIGAFVIPVYSTDGSAGTGSATLAGENGAWVGGLLAIPLAVTLLVAAALWKRREAQTAGPTAWTITGLLSAFNLIAMLSIGIFVLPVTICLVVACANAKNVAPAYPDPHASSTPR
jgi:hypothetical protein